MIQNNNTVYSNEFVVNVENVRFTLITQESAIRRYNQPVGKIIHFHSCYEMFLCARGTIYIEVGGEELSFSAGEALIVPPKVSHAITGADPGSFHGSLYFDVSPNGQECTFDLYKIMSKIINDTCSLLRGMGTLGDIMTPIRNALECKNSYEVSLYAQKFLMKLVELTGSIPQSHEAVRSDNSNLRVHNIHIFIHNHLGGTVSIEELASLLRLSTRQTSRVIKENFGCTFKELVTKLRMEKAGELMTATTHKVSEIAEMVGFSSERGFYTAFKNHFGCLPKDYRKNKN